MKVVLPKTAVKAVVDLAYRGSVDRKSLSRIPSALAGRLGRNAIAVVVDLSPDQVEVLQLASVGRRADGLAAVGSLLNGALKSLPRRPVVRRGPRRPVRPAKGQPRLCVVCGHDFPRSEFAGPDGTRCLSCRRYRMVDVKAREIPGGAPGSRR